MHLKCLESWTGYNNSKSNGSIISQISAQHKEEIVSNRTYIMKLIDLILYLSKQGISFRGHDENIASLNQGTYLPIYIPLISIV